MKIDCDCSSKDNLNHVNNYRKNKKDFFKPNQENINHFNSAKINKKRQSLSINILLFALAIIIAFFIFHEALIFVAIIGLILLLASSKTHLNSEQYHSLCDSKNVNGEHQCLFCGNSGIYKNSPCKTNITQCHCSKCKQHLFND